MSFADFYRGCRVLVTGATGFKGSWLCHWLLELGAHVSGYALAPPSSPSAWEALHLGARMPLSFSDVRDAATLVNDMQLFKPDVVFHLAAQSLVRPSYASPKETFDINVSGTINCLEAVFRQPSVQSCVVVTSDKCYENREWPWGYRETDALGGHDPYSASKAAAEIAVASYRKSFLTPVATARAGNVIGGGDWAKDRLVCDLIRAITSGQPLVLRSPNAVRSWQHVLEPLSGYLHLGHLIAQAGTCTIFADAWNFGPSIESSISVERLARALVARWGSGQVELRPDAGLHETTTLTLDASKARRQLGWRGVWSIDEAIEATVEWYRTHSLGIDNMQSLTSTQIERYTARAQALELPWSRS